MTYEDQIKIIEEIKRLRDSGCSSPISVCNDLISYIESFQEKNLNDGINKEIDFLWNKWTSSETPMYDTPEPNAMLLLSKKNFQFIAGHFTNWQRQRDYKWLDYNLGRLCGNDCGLRILKEFKQTMETEMSTTHG